MMPKHLPSTISDYVNIVTSRRVAYRWFVVLVHPSQNASTCYTGFECRRPIPEHLLVRDSRQRRTQSTSPTEVTDRLIFELVELRLRQTMTADCGHRHSRATR